MSLYEIRTARGQSVIGERVTPFLPEQDIDLSVTEIRSANSSVRKVSHVKENVNDYKDYDII